MGFAEHGIEWDPDAFATAQAAGHHRTLMDVRAFDAAPDEYVGMVASPPCTTFSRMGDGAGLAARNDLIKAVYLVAEGYLPPAALERLGVEVDESSALVLEPLRIIVETHPTWIAMEQVPSVLPIWEAYAVVLRRLGYWVETAILNAEAYGVPQTRRRAILIANREWRIGMPQPSHSRFHMHHPDLVDVGLPRWVSMAEALGWGTGEALAAEVAPRIYAPSGVVYDPTWPAGRPSPVVIGREYIAMPGVNASRHNISIIKSRSDGIRVSIEEAAALQTFPPGYPWIGTKQRQHQSAGDAIPPLLAEHVIYAARGLAMPGRSYATEWRDL
jgi:DNA (cytosine-5)-methyltransferase 1